MTGADMTRADTTLTQPRQAPHVAMIQRVLFLAFAAVSAMLSHGCDRKGTAVPTIPAAMAAIDSYIASMQAPFKTGDYIIMPQREAHALLKSPEGRAYLSMQSELHPFITFDGRDRIASVTRKSETFDAEFVAGNAAETRVTDGVLFHLGPQVAQGWPIAERPLPNGRILFAREGRVTSMRFLGDNLEVQTAFVDGGAGPKTRAFKIPWSSEARHRQNFPIALWVKEQPKP